MWFEPFEILKYNQTHVTPPPPTAQVYEGWEVWVNTWFFFVAWWLLYGATAFTFKRESEWTCRIVTLIHGSVVTYFALKDIYVTDQKFDYEDITPLSDYQKYYLSISFSYFLFDLLWIHTFGSETWIIYLHHMSSILLIFRLLWGNIGGPAISWGLAGLEFTNPYLQTRWFLRTHGYHNTPIHVIVELWFILTFLLIRAFGGTVLMYFVEVHPRLDLLTKVIFILIYFVSWLLIGQIVLFFVKKYWGRRHQITGSVMSIFPPFRQRERSIFVDYNR